MMQGIPDLSPAEQQRLQDSATLLDRSVNSVQCTYVAGGHGHVEQPSGAMSWREPSTRNWIQMANCCLILLAACAFDWDIRKTWLFASSFEPLSAIAAVCTHAQGSHKSIAGTKDEHGIYLSRRSAAYPTKLAEAFAQKNSVLLSPLKDDISWDSAFSLFPHKDWFQDPKSFVDGGGLQSSPDWSRPPADKENIFRSVRDFWIPKILQHDLHKFIVGHFQRQQVDPPFSEDLVQQFRASLDTLLPLDKPLDWQVRADQPLCLHALQAISHHMNDPDRNLFQRLSKEFPLGFKTTLLLQMYLQPNRPPRNQRDQICPSTGQTGRQQNPNQNSRRSWSKRKLKKDG